MWPRERVWGRTSSPSSSAYIWGELQSQKFHKQHHLAMIPGLGESSLLVFNEKLGLFKDSWGEERRGCECKVRRVAGLWGVTHFLDQDALLLAMTRNWFLSRNVFCWQLVPPAWFPHLTQITLECGKQQERFLEHQEWILLVAITECQGTPLVQIPDNFRGALLSNIWNEGECTLVNIVTVWIFLNHTDLSSTILWKDTKKWN